MNPRSNLIKAVFENKAKSIVDKRKVKLYDEGDEVNTNALWTPYEFLHELLPEVYRRNGYARYVVSDAEGEEIQRGIDERRLKYNTDVETALRENEVTSIYDLEADKVEELQAERKDIENSEIFITQSEIEAFLLTNTHLNKDFYLFEGTYSAFFKQKQATFLSQYESVSILKQEENPKAQLYIYYLLSDSLNIKWDWSNGRNIGVYYGGKDLNSVFDRELYFQHYNTKWRDNNSRIVKIQKEKINESSLVELYAGEIEQTIKQSGLIN